ncbi:baculoviral IAP repeat-containing protein 1f-like [Antedon mediterranea]|uniref:baculoviral IAP repeat-containing protein 1f-like n=1 Tax=Antedon mediterranea TaxID=105859 RepID=UPI003AF6E192
MASNHPVYNDESNNYYRLCYLLFEEGTKAMRKFFLTHVSDIPLEPSQFHEFMKNNKHKLCEEMLKNELLFPKEGEADIDELDITLLCSLIRRFSVSAEELNKVNRLKKFRNDRAHKPNYRISLDNFKNEWIRLAEILKALGVDEKVIDEYKTKDISATNQERIFKEIEKLGKELLASQEQGNNPTEMKVEVGIDLSISTGKQSHTTRKTKAKGLQIPKDNGEVQSMSLDQTMPKKIQVFPSESNIVENKENDLQLCINAVKHHYLQTKNPIKIPWDHSNMYRMDKLFTDQTLAVYLLSKQLKIPLKSYHDIFRQNTDGTPITRVLCYGRAGIGKSTLINKMAYDWAKKNSDSPIKRFKLVVALSMQNVSPDEDVVEAIFKHGILTEDHRIHEDLLNKFVKKQPEEVAVLLDACDEYKPQSNDSQENGGILKLLKNEHLRTSFVVVTSRPWRVDKFKEHRGIYLHCELQGFSKENVELYVDKVFQGDAEKGQALKKYLYDNGLINGIATLPMMTMILCWLWKDNASMKPPETLSELYQQLLEYMFMSHLAKNSRNEQQLDVYLNKVIEIVGRVGLDGLFKNRTLKFSESDFNAHLECEGTTKTQVVTIACEIGLLMRDMSGNGPCKKTEDRNMALGDCYFPTKPLTDRMKPEVRFLFFHKTVQEKCAAMFAAQLALREYEEFHFQYLIKIDTCEAALQFEMLLLFLSGEHKQVAKLVLNRLLKIFEKRFAGRSDDYVSGRLSFEESMRYQEYLELIIRCYHESNCCGSLNDVMVPILKHRHIRLSNFPTTTANSLGYLLKHSKSREEPSKITNLDILKIELFNIPMHITAILWEMFPNDEDKFTKKVQKYSQMPFDEITEKLRKYQKEKKPPRVQLSHFPAYHHLSFIETFSVNNRNKGDTDITPVVRSLQNVNIEKITILGFDISCMTGVLTKALRKSTLTVINLSSANVGPEMCRTVAKSLEQTRDLKELILKNNPIDDGIGYLAEKFKYIKQLTNLNVSYSPVTEKGMVTLSENLNQLQMMEKLSIYQVFDAASKSFAQGIYKMKSLKLIMLPLQRLSSEGAFIIVQQASKCRQMVELKITDMTDHCDIVVSYVATNLDKMPDLKTLSLYGKRDEGKVRIEECTIKDETCDAVVMMLNRIKSLERLKLVSLRMTKEGLEKVATACENHRNLKTFRYSGDCVPPDFKIKNFKKIQLY